MTTPGSLSPSLEQILASFAYKPKPPKSKPEQTTTTTAVAASYSKRREGGGDCDGDPGGAKYKRNRKGILEESDPTEMEKQMSPLPPPTPPGYLRESRAAPPPPPPPPKRRRTGGGVRRRENRMTTLDLSSEAEEIELEKKAVKEEESIDNIHDHHEKKKKKKKGKRKRKDSNREKSRDDREASGHVEEEEKKKKKKKETNKRRKKNKVLVVSPYFTTSLDRRIQEARVADGEEVEVMVLGKKSKSTDQRAEQSSDETREGERKKKKRRKGTSTCLSHAECFSDAYKRVPEDHPWVPPFSDHDLLQEFHFIDHWRVLVICMLLNRTTGREVQKVLPRLFLLCADAEATTKVPAKVIEEIIRPLGLQTKRAETIKKLSEEYLRPEWTHVTQLHGIGKYAADAYAIFCSGRWKEVIPKDHKLVDYWKFLIEHKDLLESVSELQPS